MKNNEWRVNFYIRNKPAESKYSSDNEWGQWKWYESLSPVRFIKNICVEAQSLAIALINGGEFNVC